MLKKLRCFAGDEDEALEHLATLLLEQAENGRPFAT